MAAATAPFFFGLGEEADGLAGSVLSSIILDFY
jgi:hypothetical protein